MITIVIEGMTENAGGKETYIMNIFRSLDKNKYKFIFISYTHDGSIAYEKELVESGAEIVHITLRSVNPLAYYRDLDRLFKKNKVDVIWTHKTTLSACESLQIAKKNHVPVRIIHSHCSENMGGRFTLFMHNFNKKRINKFANVRMACSDVASKWFYGDQDSMIMKNAINLDKFRFDLDVRNRIREELGIGNKLVIGHVGRFSVEKNHKKLLHVFKHLHDKNPDSILLLCGDGEERSNIESLIQDLQIQDSVCLLGLVSNVHEMLQACDILVMPSLFEGLPFALLEAQASGLKCVVSDTVSSESNVMGWNIAVPLNASDQEWGNAINSVDFTYNREDAFEKMKIMEFDLADNIKLIEQIIDETLDL